MVRHSQFSSPSTSASASRRSRRTNAVWRWGVRLQQEGLVDAAATFFTDCPPSKKTHVTVWGGVVERVEKLFIQQYKYFPNTTLSVCFFRVLCGSFRVPESWVRWDSNSRLRPHARGRVGGGSWPEKKTFQKVRLTLKGPKLNVLIRDKISFVGVAHLTRSGGSCSWALYRFFYRILSSNPIILGIPTICFLYSQTFQVGSRRCGSSVTHTAAADVRVVHMRSW